MFELLKGDGRGGWASGSEWTQNKNHNQIATGLGSSYPQLVHRLSTACEYLSGYPQVIQELSTAWTDLSTGYPPLIHKLFTGQSERRVSDPIPVSSRVGTSSSIEYRWDPV